MSEFVRKIGLAARDVNEDALRLVEATLERVRSGEVTSVAIAEVRRGRMAATAFSRGEDYHLLNSSAARLAVQLASIPDEDDEW